MSEQDEQATPASTGEENKGQKDKVVKITLHSGMSEDCSLEWSELIFTYEDGKEELVSRITTSSESPEDNTLSRIGEHNIKRVIQAVEINSKITYEEVYHENSYGYLQD